MDNFEAHKIKFFCYNIGVPRKRGDLIFVIGSPTLHRRSDLFCNVWRTFGPAHSCVGQNPGGAALIKPPQMVGRDHRARRSGELRKRIRRPRHARNSVLVLPRKPLLSRTRQEYGVAPYGNHAAQPLFLCFVQARSGASRKQGFEGAPLFFSAPKRRHPVW